MENQSLPEYFEKRDGKFTYKLLTPIHYGQDIISTLELTEPKAKHIRQMPANPKSDDTLKVLGALCSQPDSVIDELSLKDVGRLSEFIEAFS